MLLELPRRAFLVQKCEEIAWGRPKGSKNPEKKHPKIFEKMMPKKVTKCIPKAFQNDAKTDTKIIEKTMRFRNLRFLGFCKEYKLKIVFLHDLGNQKQAKIDQKSMPKRG